MTTQALSGRASSRVWCDQLRYLVANRIAFLTRSRLLGLWWWLIEPLALTLTYYVMVKVAFKSGGDLYLLSLMCAILPWTWFTASTSTAAVSLMHSVDMIKAVRISYLLFPTSEVIAGTIRFAMSLVILAGLLIYYRLMPGWSLLWLPVVILVQFVLTLGISCWLAIANVYVEDTLNIWTQLTRIWFFLSPSIYIIDQIPERLQSTFLLNPFAVIFTSYRDVFMHGAVPDLLRLGLVLGLSVMILLSGVQMLRRQQGKLALMM